MPNRPKIQTIPPSHSADENLDEKPHFALDNYSVCEWTPQRDGKGTPEQVHVVFDVAEGAMAFVMAFKSERSIDEFIGLLQRHRNGVFGSVSS